MSTFKRKLRGFVAGSILVWAGSATAVPLPAPPLVPPVAGESDLTSFTAPDDLTVDWMVIPDPGGGLYGGPYPAGSFIYLL